MKGLLLKDFYQLIKYCRSFFIIDVIFIGVSLFVDGAEMFVYFPIIFSAILPMTLLSYDERSGWMEYSGTLPYSANQIVSAKYLFGLIVQTVTASVVIGVEFVSRAIYNAGGLDMASDIFIKNLLLIGIMFVVSLLCPAICIPFCFKFGTEKGRIAYFVIIALLAAVCMSLYNKYGDQIQLLSKNYSWVLLPILGGIAVLYVVSWIASIPLLRSVKK